jgi:hypothetical protein
LKSDSKIDATEGLHNEKEDKDNKRKLVKLSKQAARDSAL